LRTRTFSRRCGSWCFREVCLRLPAELGRVDLWLDDDQFFAQFRGTFDARIGRPSVPVETYLLC